MGVYESRSPAHQNSFLLGQCSHPSSMVVIFSKYDICNDVRWTEIDLI